MRRSVQIASIAILVLLPLFALYTHFHSARAIGDLPEGSWRTAALRQIDEFVSHDESRLAAVQSTQGTFWSARVLGYSLSDPLAGTEAIVSSRSLYVPLLWSLLVPVALSLVLGRVFCGWICPMNTLLEVVDKCRRWLGVLEIRERDVRFSKRTKYLVLALSLGFVAIGGIPFLAMIYPPAVISREMHLIVFGTGLGLGAYLILAICAFELFVSRRWWCRYVCPGGAVYSLLGRFRPIRIRRNTEKCIECGDCIRACQFDLRPMMVETTGMECTNCGTCVKACDSRALTYSIVLPGIGGGTSTVKTAPIPRTNKMTNDEIPGGMTNDEIPNGEGSPNDECRMSKRRASGCIPFVIRASSLFRHWVFRHSSFFLFLVVALVPQTVFGHHILGLPHYSYKENYPQAPTLEYPATTGPYDVLMTSYPGRPVPAEAATVCFYIKDRNTSIPYGQPVTVRVLETATFGSNTVIHEPATHQPFDNQHKYTITFPDEAEYIVELTMDVEGKTEVIPFLVVVGEPTATTSVVITIIAGLGVFLVVVRAVKKKRDRRKATQPAAPTSKPATAVPNATS